MAETNLVFSSIFIAILRYSFYFDEADFHLDPLSGTAWEKNHCDAQNKYKLCPKVAIFFYFFGNEKS